MEYRIVDEEGELLKIGGEEISGLNEGDVIKTTEDSHLYVGLKYLDYTKNQYSVIVVKEYPR